MRKHNQENILDTITYSKTDGLYKTTNKELAKSLSLTYDNFDEVYFTADEHALFNSDAIWDMEDNTLARLTKRAKVRKASRAVKPPKSFNVVQPHDKDFVFEPYQEAGIYFITRSKLSLLADDMGVGKTAQAIGMCNYLGLGKILVVCPSALKLNWEREFQKFSSNPDFTHQVIFDKKDVEGLTPETQANVTIINYELLIREPYKSAIQGLTFEQGLYDESHALKSIEAQRTWAVLGGSGTIQICDRNLFITGTPILNHSYDIFPMVAACAPSILRPYHTDAKFKKRYTQSYVNRGVEIITGSKNEKELRNALRSTIMLRRSKKDVFGDYREPTISVVPIKLKPADHARYIKDEKEEIPEDSLKDILSPNADLGEMSRERSMLSKAKVPQTVEYIKMLRDSGADKVIVFGYHTKGIKELEKKLKKFKPVLITGEVSSKDKQKAIDTFQNDPNCKILISNIFEGYTATAAHDVVFMETPWSPEMVKQAIARADRKGQLEHVTAHMLVVLGSMDDRVTSARYKKAQTIEKIMD